MTMKKLLLPAAVLAGTLGLIPFALIAKARVSTSEKPRLHLIRDMDYQASVGAQEGNSLFADGRGMRAPVPGTVARGELCELRVGAVEFTGSLPRHPAQEKARHVEQPTQRQRTLRLVLAGVLGELGEIRCHELQPDAGCNEVGDEPAQQLRTEGPLAPMQPQER